MTTWLHQMRTLYFMDRWGNETNMGAKTQNCTPPDVGPPVNLGTECNFCMPVKVKPNLSFEELTVVILFPSLLWFERCKAASTVTKLLLTSFRRLVPDLFTCQHEATRNNSFVHQVIRKMWIGMHWTGNTKTLCKTLIRFVIIKTFILKQRYLIGRSKKCENHTS